MKMEDKEFFSMRDVSNLFGVSLSLVKQKLRWELGTPVRIGKCLRWTRSQIEAYVKNNRAD